MFGSARKARLDKLLVDLGHVASRERAQALILAGKVLVDEQKITKAGTQVAESASIRLLGEDLRYVGRGGLKLERALAHWDIDVRGRICIDIGASTGGFTDCLLQHGAARVIAVDTGYGQMDYRLRADARVRLLERTNARFLTAAQIAAHIEKAVSFVAIDVSFISAALVLPAVVSASFGEGTSRDEIVVLVKPQFEAGREHVGKGGIVRDAEAQKSAVDKIRRVLMQLGFTQLDCIESPIRGAEGNREFLLYARRDG